MDMRVMCQNIRW